MSVIIRLQNLPWSANALDIRNYFRGLSIPEGGVHIVGGELGDAFIAFSTDEDARQGMMMDGGKIKEIQVKLLLSSRSEMHKVIEAARQSVPILTLAPAPVAPAPVAPVPAPAPAPIAPTITPFSAALGNNPLSSFGIPGIGNPQEIPQPAVIEPPAPLISPTNTNPDEDKEDDRSERSERKRSREKDRRRSRSRSKSRDRDRKERKRDRRDRSRSRERRRRDRSRSRDRRDRKRDRKDRSRSHDRSPSRRSRDRRERKSPRLSQEKIPEVPELPNVPAAPIGINKPNVPPHLQQQMMLMNSILPNGGVANDNAPARFDPSMTETFNKLQELGKKRNPNAFQGQQDQPSPTPQNGGRFQGGRGGATAGAPARGGGSFRRGERPSRFENDCCVVIKNAPNHTSYGDVRRFFPFMIDKHGIKMINDNMGRRTGNIFVRFCDPRSRQLALQRKNNELKGAQVVIDALDDESYDTAVDSFLPYREDNDEDETLVIADDDPKPSYSVLKLSDLPNFVKEHDIIKTFSEFSLLSIMLNDCRMTRTKVAFVQFAKVEDAKVAFDRKDRYMFGRRQPTITTVTDDDYEKEKVNLNEKMPEIPPPKVSEPQPEVQAPRDPRQRRQFDNGGPKGGPAPQGPPFFAGPYVQQNAMPQNFVPQFPGNMAGPQFSAFPGPAALDPRTAAANWANRPGGPMNQMGPMQGMRPQGPGMPEDDEPLDCVLMKGLPRDATDRTIVTFLSDTGAVPARIHLMLDPSGAPSGDCFCEFRSTQEARMAASKHGNNLDGCRVTIDLVTRIVVEEALEGPKQQNEMGGGVGAGLLGNAPPQYFDGGSRGGFNPRGGYRGRGNFDSNRGNFDSNRGNFDSNRGGNFDRGGFNNRGGFDNGRGNFRGRGFDRGGRGFDRGRGRGFGPRGRGGGQFDNGRDHPMRHDDEDPALEDFGAPGCVVSMENVPFRASIDEIMTFFSEFELTQDDLIRRYNERGQPTGDARVAFRTPFDAQRAVKTRHMDTIHDRRISLTIL